MKPPRLTNMNLNCALVTAVFLQLLVFTSLPGLRIAGGQRRAGRKLPLTGADPEGAIPIENAPARQLSRRLPTGITLCNILGGVIAIGGGTWLARRVGRPWHRQAQAAPTPDCGEKLPGKRGTVAAEHRHGEQELAYLAVIASCSDDAIISMTLDGIVTSWNPGAERIFGFRADEMVGQPITRIIPAELQHEEDEILARLRRRELIDHYETVRIAKDGRRVEVSITVSPVIDSKGRLIGASKISRDLTARKKADEHQRLLSTEVNHRANNLLAVVQSIISQSARTADSGRFADAICRRVQGLAATQRLIVEGSWDVVDLADLAGAQLASALGMEPERVTLAGPPVKLSPSAAQMMGMAPYELANNAVEHGALRHPTGSIELGWNTIGESESAVLHVSWKERGAPAIELPRRVGFGTRVLSAVGSALRGEVRADFQPEGFTWFLRAPLIGTSIEVRPTTPRA